MIMAGAELEALRPHAIVGASLSFCHLLGPHAIVGAEFLPVVVWAGSCRHVGGPQVALAAGSP